MLRKKSSQNFPQPGTVIYQRIEMLRHSITVPHKRFSVQIKRRKDNGCDNQKTAGVDRKITPSFLFYFFCLCHLQLLFFVSFSLEQSSCSTDPRQRPFCSSFSTADSEIYFRTLFPALRLRCFLRTSKRRFTHSARRCISNAHKGINRKM